MKVKITFEYQPAWLPFAYWAKAGAMEACGESYAEAERRLLEKLRATATAAAPPPEKEVELL